MRMGIMTATFINKTFNWKVKDYLNATFLKQTLRQVRTLKIN